jgi:hypothetical protein
MHSRIAKRQATAVQGSSLDPPPLRQPAPVWAGMPVGNELSANGNLSLSFPCLSRGVHFTHSKPPQSNRTDCGRGLRRLLQRCGKNSWGKILGIFSCKTIRWPRRWTRLAESAECLGADRLWDTFRNSKDDPANALLTQMVVPNGSGRQHATRLWLPRPEHPDSLRHS